MSTSQDSPAETLRSLVLRFVDAFNRNDLDEVMRFFAPNARYVTYDGKQWEGPSQIRKAFAPQFQGVFGVMTFQIEELIIDEQTQRAVVTWSCVHDLQAGAQTGGRPNVLSRLIRGVYGPRYVWRGLDVLLLDHQLIREKRTYSQSHLPLGSGQKG